MIELGDKPVPVDELTEDILTALEARSITPKDFIRHTREGRLQTGERGFINLSLPASVYRLLCWQAQYYHTTVGKLIALNALGLQAYIDAHPDAEGADADPMALVANYISQKSSTDEPLPRM